MGKTQRKSCALVVRAPISPSKLVLLTAWIKSDRRRNYFLLFVGENDGLDQENKLEFFRHDARYECIWDENETRLGLQIRYQLETFANILVDSECPDSLCSLVFAGLSIRGGVLFDIESSGVSFRIGDCHAKTDSPMCHERGDPTHSEDSWYPMLNTAIAKSTVADNTKLETIFPNWLDAWADSYVNLFRSEGNNIFDVLSSLAHSLTQIERTAIRWTDVEAVVWILTVLISRLKRCAKKKHFNLLWPEDDIVAHIFAKKKLESVRDKFNYSQGHVICALRFMQWLIRAVVMGENVFGLIENLIPDLYVLNAQILRGEFDDLFSGHYFGRCGVPLSRNQHFRDAYRVAIYQSNPVWRITSEIMGIAGLRQALESGFSRIIGLRATDAHIFHDLIPSALQNCNKIYYPNASCRSPMDKVMLIYAWTNTAVHQALSDASWMVWKAFDYSSVLFTPQPPSVLKGFNENSAVQMPITALYEIRRAVSDGLCDWARNAHVNVVNIEWGEPEAVITGGRGKDMNWGVLERKGV